MLPKDGYIRAQGRARVQILSKLDQRQLQPGKRANKIYVSKISSYCIVIGLIKLPGLLLSKLTAIILLMDVLFC